MKSRRPSRRSQQKSKEQKRLQKQSKPLTTRQKMKQSKRLKTLAEEMNQSQELKATRIVSQGTPENLPQKVNLSPETKAKHKLRTVSKRLPKQNQSLEKEAEMQRIQSQDRQKQMLPQTKQSQLTQTLSKLLAKIKEVFRLT